MDRASALVLVLAISASACGGLAPSSSGDAGLDASVVDAAPRDGASSDPCARVDAAGCEVQPLTCLQGSRPTLVEVMKKYEGLSPADVCPPPSSWVERYEACGLVEIHSFQGPPFSYVFDAKTGALVGTFSASDTECRGYGTVFFPCDGVVQCTHLCGAVSGAIEPPMCPPALDAGPG